MGTVGPLMLGDDELVYTMASGGEEDLVRVTALVNTQGLAGRPTSIISFNSEFGSATGLVSSSQPIGTNSGTALDGAVEDYHMPAGPATTSGVTEVVAMAEVSVNILLVIC